MSNFRVEFPNLKKVVKRLKTIPGNIEREFAKALFSEMEFVAGESKERFVPVDTGALRGSIHATKPKIKNGKVSSSVVAGGPSTKYAFRVHEWLRPGVNWSVLGTGPKYLEKPFNARIFSIEKQLEAAIGRAVKSRRKLSGSISTKLTDLT